MERRFFLKFMMLSSVPIFSFGKIKMHSVMFENGEEVSLKKDLRKKDNDKEILESFLTPDPDERLLKNFLKGEDVYLNRSRISNRGLRRLNLYNPHTNERFQKTYYSNGRYREKVLSDLNYFLRDFRERKTRDIDVELIDLVYSLQQSMSTTKPLTVLSGYRTRKTNNKLRKRLKGVAKNSYHIKGRAIDLAPYNNSRYKLKRMRDLAINKEIGGVGYYRKSGFVHVDTGPVRYWS